MFGPVCCFSSSLSVWLLHFSIGYDCQCEIIFRGVLMLMLQCHIMGINLKLNVDGGVIFL